MSNQEPVLRVTDGQVLNIPKDVAEKFGGRHVKW